MHLHPVNLHVSCPHVRHVSFFHESCPLSFAGKTWGMSHVNDGIKIIVSPDGGGHIQETNWDLPCDFL